MGTCGRVSGQREKPSSRAESEITATRINSTVSSRSGELPCPPLRKGVSGLQKPLHAGLLTTVLFIFSTVTIVFTVTSPGHGDTLSGAGATADFINAACSHIC